MRKSNDMQQRDVGNSNVVSINNRQSIDKTRLSAL